MVRRVDAEKGLRCDYSAIYHSLKALSASGATLLFEQQPHLVFKIHMHIVVLLAVYTTWVSGMKMTNALVRTSEGCLCYAMNHCCRAHGRSPTKQKQKKNHILEHPSICAVGKTSRTLKLPGLLLDPRPV